jgi:hypothetical protein
MKINNGFFWSKVVKTETIISDHVSSPCWVWSASKDKRGYGNFNVGHKCMKAHRVSWIINFGEVPNGLCVCHHCDNPSCVRPDHLWIGTHKQNMSDCRSKNRSGFIVHPERMATGERHSSVTHPESIPRGENHPMVKHPELRSYGVRNGTKTHPERIARGIQRALSKLNDSKVVEIRSLRLNGSSLLEIAHRYGVSISVISEICNYKAWTHVK